LYGNKSVIDVISKYSVISLDTLVTEFLVSETGW